MVPESTDASRNVNIGYPFLWLTLGFIAKVRYFPEGCILYAITYTMCKILETLYPGL
jgi:hypothetical protein